MRKLILIGLCLLVGCASSPRYTTTQIDSEIALVLENDTGRYVVFVGGQACVAGTFSAVFDSLHARGKFNLFAPSEIKRNP